MNDVSNTEVAVFGAAEAGEGALKQIFEAIETGVTGLPAPVRKNFMKVAAQLCTAAIDIPVAMLEGKAAEIRAASKGRVKLIGTSSNQLADQMRSIPSTSKQPHTSSPRRWCESRSTWTRPLLLPTKNWREVRSQRRQLPTSVKTF